MRGAIPSTLTLLALLLASGRVALADDIPCQLVERDVIAVDGLLDDWNGVTGLEVGDGDKDHSFTARCNHDASTLYLSIDVRDDYLVRTPAATAIEDHVELVFGGAGGKVDRLIIHPADGKIGRKVRWSSGAALARGVTVADSKQPRGWSVEVGLPLRAVPGWSPGVPSVRLAVAVSDSDSKSSPTQKALLTTGPLDRAEALGVIEFADSRATLDAFLKDRRLVARDVTFDQTGRVTGKPKGKGRVVVAGRYLAIVTDEYIYLELPVRERKDLLEIKLVDLASDGRDAILLRYLERGGGGAREVLAAYRLDAAGLKRVFAVEVGKTLGANRLATRNSVVRTGKAGKTQELVVEPLPAVGWTEATYKETPADDVEPIPLPWPPPVKPTRFVFKGDGYTRF